MDKTLVFAGDVPASTLNSQVRRGDLIQVARGVYSTETDRSPEDIVRSHWTSIVGRLFPDAVITDRSARRGGIVDGVLYLAHPARNRDVDLPGLSVRARSGAGPLDDDIPYAGGLHLASEARGLAENTRPSRARSGAPRTLNADEIGDWVDYVCQARGEDGLAAVRTRSEQVAPDLGVTPTHLKTLHDAVGVAMGTRDSQRTGSSPLRLRRSGTPVDQARAARFEHLARALAEAAPQSRPDDSVAGQPGRTRYLPFFEGYFSNFIEGTEFEVDEAADIVFNGYEPEGRPGDAHDIRGTYALLSDPDKMVLTGSDADEFIDLIQRRHRIIMEGRPEMNPGVFKQRDNRAGETHFVEWDLVEGTLRAGFAHRDTLDTAWERALYVAFVVAEVHPFADGNGRTARAMMNAELTAANQSRIIVPSVFRQDYLDGLRALSRRDDPSIFIKGMRYAHDFTAAIDYTDYEQAKAQLNAANAFNEPDSADRLLVPGRRRSWETGPPTRLPDTLKA